MSSNLSNLYVMFCIAEESGENVKLSMIQWGNISEPQSEHSITKTEIN